MLNNLFCLFEGVTGVFQGLPGIMDMCLTLL